MEESSEQVGEHDILGGIIGPRLWQVRGGTGVGGWGEVEGVEVCGEFLDGVRVITDTRSSWAVIRSILSSLLVNSFSRTISAVSPF